VVGVFVAVIVALGVVWVLFVPAAGWLAHLDVGSARGSQLQTARDDAQGRLLTLGAGLFAAGALIFTARNYTLSREGQITDRYTKAIEQLGSDSLDVRTGAIYSLERVVRDSARDHPTVMEVLAAFVREQSHERWPLIDDQSTADVPPRVTRPDVQAAVAVIGRRDPKNDRKAVNLSSADLTGADLTEADLAGAQLNGANLTGAQLNRANLTGAQLNNVDLTGAQLNGARLTGAQLTRANLTSADLTSADLADAWLPGVDFTRADLDSARLTGANLAEITLTDANLRFADLTSANLTGANMKGMNLFCVYLTKTVWPPGTAVPEGWQRDPGSGRLAENPSTAVKPAGLPGWLREYLFAGERIALAVRPHPIVVLGPGILIVAGLVAALALTTGQNGVAYSSKLIWPLYALPFLWAIWRIVNWRSTYFVVTEKRLILADGVFNKNIQMMSLAKVTDIRVDRTWIGRALDYGKLVAESAGQEGPQSSVACVPYPDELSRQIIALLYPKTAG
jgi:uncharacterized protein YjbI with pentapeptide repeats